MPNQDVWEFAGPEDAKTEFMLPRSICLAGLPAALAMTLCRKSLRSFSMSRRDCREISRIPWTADQHMTSQQIRNPKVTWFAEIYVNE